MLCFRKRFVAVRAIGMGAFLLGMLSQGSVAGETPTAPQAKPFAPLSPAEEKLASFLALTDHKIKELLGSTGERIVCSTDLITSPFSGEQTTIPRRVRVILYNRANSQGASSIVDLSTHHVDEQQAIDAEDVPLAPQDVQDARHLVLKDRRAHELVESPLHELESQVVLYHALEDEDACKKHRCVNVLFRRPDGTYLTSISILVDLTSRSISISKNHQ